MRPPNCCLKVHKEEGSPKNHLTCSQRIWDKCEYMFEMYALIYHYLGFLKINTYRGVINKEWSKTCYNT